MTGAILGVVALLVVVGPLLIVAVRDYRTARRFLAVQQEMRKDHAREDRRARLLQWQPAYTRDLYPRKD